MVTLNFPQGSLDWLTARLWRLTSSELKASITATGALSKSEAAMKHIYKLIAGIDLANEMNARADEINEMDDWELKKFMSHYNGDSFKGSIHTERGNEFEADAIAAMSERIGHQIRDVGMCVMGDDENGVVSCSPDGLIYGPDGKTIITGAEVKSPCLFNYYNIIQNDILPAEYKLQVHASMAICEVDSWNFGAFFKGKPLFHKEVKRDKLTDKIGSSLLEFRSLYEEKFGEVREREADMNVEKEAA